MTRPTKYKEEYAGQARKLCLLGYTDSDLADFFGVAESTIDNWKLKHNEFMGSIKDGKDIADSEVAEALYNRAMGYSHKEERIIGDKVIETEKHYPPDTAACFIWLKNRQRHKWRDKQEIESTGNLTIKVVRFGDNNTE